MITVEQVKVGDYLISHVDIYEYVYSTKPLVIRNKKYKIVKIETHLDGLPHWFYINSEEGIEGVSYRDSNDMMFISLAEEREEKIKSLQW